MNTFVVQSGKENIGIAFLMPQKCMGIGVKGHLCGLCVEGEQKFARQTIRSWLRPKTVSALFGKLNIESAVPEFPCPVGQFYHPDIWNTVGGTESAVCA